MLKLNNNRKKNPDSCQKSGQSNTNQSVIPGNSLNFCLKRSFPSYPSTILGALEPALPLPCSGPRPGWHGLIPAAAQATRFSSAQRARNKTTQSHTLLGMQLEPRNQNVLLTWAVKSLRTRLAQTESVCPDLLTRTQFWGKRRALEAYEKLWNWRKSYRCW